MNDELARNLNNALLRCSNYYVDEKCGRFNKMYPFTTENISGYIDYFPLKDHSLLTVGSSGDQVINAIDKGCTDITLLDINPYSRYYYYLKVASLIIMNIDDFRLFLRFVDYPKKFQDNYNVFNKELFNKVTNELKFLDNDSYIFWNKLFSNFDPLLVREELFSKDESDDKSLNLFNSYLNSTNYKELKDKLEYIKPKFITGDLFLTEIKQKYDNIWLSSIGPFLRSFEKIKEMTDKMASLLNDNGLLLISYLYATTKVTPYESDYSLIYDLEKIYALLSDYQVELKTFLGVNFNSWNPKIIQDSILLCRKK